jgi:hypothetical protein
MLSDKLLILLFVVSAPSAHALSPAVPAAVERLILDAEAPPEPSTLADRSWLLGDRHEKPTYFPGMENYQLY